MSTSVRELQMALLDMLVKIDELCKKYEINYSLSSGTVWEQYAMVDLYHWMMIWI